jgi:ATP-binding cassette subfamily F protein uup
MLLDQATLEIHTGEKLCVVGRNGEGKSSMLRVLAGCTPPDSGELWRAPGLKTAYLAQDRPAPDGPTVFDIVAEGLAEVGSKLTEFHELTRHLHGPNNHDATEAAIDPKKTSDRLSALHEWLDHHDGWRLDQRIATVLTKLSLRGDDRMTDLSGGWRRRAFLGRALVAEPDVLILDEPTNHLDLDAILWLEEFLIRYPSAVLFVSHDRAFAQRVATRILDLDRGKLTSWPGNYERYLEKKSHALEIETRHDERFDKKLAEEETWIRQGIKARRTRNEGRVRALKKLREQRAQRREIRAGANLHIEEASASSAVVIEAIKVGFAYGDKRVIDNFNVRIQRGERVGIVGRNGAGKSTLLKLMLGELRPSAGKLRRGEQLEVAYFDQLRDQLNPDESVFHSVAGGSEFVQVGERTRHVAGYLSDFLFARERHHSPVRTLSGGERNRLLLARLFARPSNLLVLDEPTNDLDLETLELLEQRIADYEGTLLIVSHDRAFLDHVVTSLLTIDDEGHVSEYVGGYTDFQHYLAQQQQAVHATHAAHASSTPTTRTGTRAASTDPHAGPVHPTSSAPPGRPAPATRKKLSYQQQRLYDSLPSTIESLEDQKRDLEREIHDPEFYKHPSELIATKLHQLEQLNQQIDELYRQWSELEATLL